MDKQKPEQIECSETSVGRTLHAWIHLGEEVAGRWIDYAAAASHRLATGDVFNPVGWVADYVDMSRGVLDDFGTFFRGVAGKGARPTEDWVRRLQMPFRPEARAEGTFGCVELPLPFEIQEILERDESAAKKIEVEQMRVLVEGSRDEQAVMSLRIEPHFDAASGELHLHGIVDGGRTRGNVVSAGKYWTRVLWTETGQTLAIVEVVVVGEGDPAPSAAPKV